MPAAPLPAEAVRARRRLNTSVFLAAATTPVAGALFAVAVFVALAKLALPGLTIWAAGLALVLLPAALVWAWRRCIRENRFFDAAQTAEVIDHFAGADGLATSVFEKPQLAPRTDFWSALTPAALQHLRLNPRYFAARMAPSVLFLAIAAAIPPREAEAVVSARVNQTLTEPVKADLQTAAELIPEQQREQIANQLDQVEQAEGAMTAEKWEAAEDAAAQLEAAVARATAAAQRVDAAAGEVSGMLARKEQNPEAANSPEASAELAAAMEKMAKELASGKGTINEQLRQQLSDALKNAKAGKAGSKEMEELRKKLSEQLKQCEGLCQGNKPSNKPGNGSGKGGINRGRADAEISYGEKRQLDEAKFDQQRLENQILPPQDLVSLGITAVEPDTTAGESNPSAVQEIAPTAGSQIMRTQVSPSQRDVVRRYFEE